MCRVDPVRAQTQSSRRVLSPRRPFWVIRHLYGSPSSFSAWRCAQCREMLQIRKPMSLSCPAFHQYVTHCSFQISHLATVTLRRLFLYSRVSDQTQLCLSTRFRLVLGTVEMGWWLWWVDCCPLLAINSVLCCLCGLHKARLDFAWVTCIAFPCSGWIIYSRSLWIDMIWACVVCLYVYFIMDVGGSIVIDTKIIKCNIICVCKRTSSADSVQYTRVVWLDFIVRYFMHSWLYLYSTYLICYFRCSIIKSLKAVSRHFMC